MAGIGRGIVAGRARLIGLVDAARTAASAQFAELRLRAASEPPRRRIAWGAVVLTLFLVPAAFNAARESSFTASIEIFPRKDGPYPGPSDPEYYRAFLADPHLQQQMLLNAGAGAGEYQNTTFSRTEHGTVLLSVESKNAARARDLANALAPQIANASGRQALAQAAQEATIMRGQLRYQRLPADARRQLRRRLRVIEDIGAEPPHRAVLGGPAAEPRPDRWADRVADALPGELPKRQSPAAAALAGLLLACTLWVIGLVLAPPAPAPSAAPREARPPPAIGQPWAIALPRRAYTALLALAAAVLVAIIMVVGGVLETFRLDEWHFIADRHESSLDVYLAPHNEHLSTIPVIAFKALFATVGLDEYWPYRLMVAPLAVLLGVLVYFYAAPRIGRGWAFVPGILTMLIGQGAYDIFWPFQIGFNLSVACGVGILLCFDRPGKRSDLIAGALVVIALLSSSIGLAVAAAAVVEVALSRGERIARGLRIIAAPVVLYVAWWLHYRPERLSEPAALGEMPRLIFEVSGTATAALAGAPLGLRLPAALVLLAAVVVGLTRTNGRSRRALVVACSLPFAFWALLMIGRGGTGEVLLLDSRYILPGSVFVACVLAEVLRGTTARMPVWMAALVAVVVFGAMANNVRYLRNAANLDAEARAEPARAQAAALFLAGQPGPIDPRFHLGDVPFPNTLAPTRLVEGFDRYGPPAAEPDATISASSPAIRAAADWTYFGARAMRARPAPAPPTRAGCRTLPGPSAEVAVPPTGIALRGSGRGAITVGLRRWGTAPMPHGTAPERGWSRLVPGRDDAQTPVRAVIQGFEVRVCRL